MPTHSLLRRALVTLRHGGLLLVIAGLLLLGSISLLPMTPVRAIGPADIATQLPVQPTEPPLDPTDLPVPDPTDSPAPTELPDPTQPPAATEQPEPTDPPAPSPRPTEKDRPDDDDDDPTPTPVPPTATPVPPTATPVPTTNIRVRKVVNVDTATPGDMITYTIVVENTGSSPAYDVVLTDTVPDQVEVTDLQSGKGDIVLSGQQVTAYPSTLEPGEQASYTVTGRVRGNAQPGSTVENTVTITTSTPGDDPGDNTSTVTFRIPVPPAVAPPVPTARTNIIFRVPPTADPNDAGLLWSLLPWVVIGLLLVGVGGLLAWSIASTRGLTQHLLAFMAPRALAPTGSVPDTVSLQEPPTSASTASSPLRPSIPMLRTDGAIASASRASSAGVPPLGTLFDEPEPLAPLPPPAALDRESVLRPSQKEI